MRVLRRHIWLLVCLGFIAPLYVVWTANDQIGQFANDGPYYLMMARHYSPYTGESAVNAASAALSRFPPLYPLILALAGSGIDLYSTHLLTTAFLIAGLIAYYAWLLLQDFAPAPAALLVLLIAAVPGSWLLGLVVQSEYLYLCWSLLALIGLLRYQRSGRDEALYLAAIAIAAAVLTRSIGITLYLPLLFAARRAPRRTALLAITAAVLPFLLWQLLHHSPLSYTSALRDIYGRHFWRVLQQQLALELPALRSGFAANFMLGAGPVRIADGLAALCLAAAAARALQRQPDGIYVAAYLAILLVWPYPEEASRFVWVILPLLLAQIVLLISQCGHVRPDGQAPRLATAVMAAAALSTAVPAVAFAAGRYRAAAYSSLPAARGFTAWYNPDYVAALTEVNAELTIIGGLQRIRDEIPEHDCVIAIRADLINYYADRFSFLPPLNSVPDPYFQAQLRAPGCRYVYMSTATHMMFPLPLHPMQRLGPHVQILDYADIPAPLPARSRATSILAAIE